MQTQRGLAFNALLTTDPEIRGLARSQQKNESALLTTNPLPNSPGVRKTPTEVLELLWMHRSIPAIVSPS